MKNKVFLIDLYGTIVEDDRKMVDLFIHEWIRYFGAKGDKEDIKNMWTTIYIQLKEKHCGDMFLKRGELQQMVLNWLFKLFLINASADDYANRLYYHRTNANPLPGAIEFLNKLIKNKADYFILTNGDSYEVNHIIKKYDIPVSKGVITSEDVLYYKPTSKMFLDVINKFKLDKNSIINIGDSHWSDATGATKLGIKSIWFNRLNRAIEPPKGSFVAKSFDSILKIIEEI